MTDEVAHVAYGSSRIPVRLDSRLAQWRVITPAYEPALPDPHSAFVHACSHPTESPPLRDVVRPSDRVVIVTSDRTRPLPNRLLIPWILEMLPSPERVTVLIGTGSHQVASQAEIAAAFGATAQRVRIVSHDAFDSEKQERVGEIGPHFPVFLNREYVNADIRIALGFIEPHFFAGFSGGPKAVVPGIAGIETILASHSFPLIAAPGSTWGVLDGNPLHESVSRAAALCPPHFLINVALNTDKDLTAVFAGHYVHAHRAGCVHVGAAATVPVPHLYPVVVTSNSGYPLDQNLYQSVKGLSAAARILAPGGTIFMASECRDGLPDHGLFGAMLRRHNSIEGVDAELRGRTATQADQWQVQVLLQVLQRGRVLLHSALDDDTVRACGLTPVADIDQSLEAHLRKLGPKTHAAVLPDGPQTIPHCADAAYAQHA
jgi:nickel-dependent lactate racemase